MGKLLFLYSLLAVFKLQSQDNKRSNFDFLDVNILVNELRKNDYVSYHEFTLDYLSILTLDISSLSTLKKLDPWYFEKYDVSEYKKKRKFSYDFSSIVKFKNIQTLFLNEKLFEKMTKGKIKYSDLGERIYIKNNRIAIFETNSSDFSSSHNSKYKVTLFNGIVYFELIFSEIADYALPFLKEMKQDSVLIDIPKK